MIGRVEARGGLHQAQRLAVALRVRHAEVALDVLLGVAALLVPDHHHRLPVEARPAADDRRIVAEQAVAVQLDEVGEDRREVVERVRAPRMPRHLHPLHRREAPVDLAAPDGQLVFQRADLAGDINAAFVADPPQLLDLALELGERFFEVQRIGDGHAVSLRSNQETASLPKRSRRARSVASSAPIRNRRDRSRADPPLPSDQSI